MTIGIEGGGEMQDDPLAVIDRLWDRGVKVLVTTLAHRHSLCHTWRMETITDIRVAVERLGGRHEVARLCGVGARAVSNWVARGRIPSDHILRLMRRAEGCGLTMADALFERPRLVQPDNGGVGSNH